MTTSSRERRSAKRHRPTDLDAVVLSGLPEQFREVKVRSISKTGLAIEINIEDVSPLQAQLGRRITLSFLLPQVARIATVQAEVVRTYRQVSDGGFIHVSADGKEKRDSPYGGHENRVYGLGLRFVDLRPEMARQLERYLLTIFRGDDGSPDGNDEDDE
ncbi:MAG: hypothetical protein GF403_03195 [Candidatus Coatesbacteria bacterium]|nr:hypothetical protein [Candidatus Coatesbacteria bacterium]